MCTQSRLLHPPSLQLVQMNCISQRANRVSLMWSPSVLRNDLSSPLGTHIQVLCCLARWLCMHHQSCFCEWGPVSVKRIMSSIVNLAVFLWIIAHSETTSTPIPFLFLCGFTETVMCISTQIFFFFLKRKRRWWWRLNFMILFPNTVLGFISPLEGQISGAVLN